MLRGDCRGPFDALLYVGVCSTDNVTVNNNHYIKKVKLSMYEAVEAVGLSDVEASAFYRQSAHIWQ
jgi:hypothetical protein